MTTITGRPDATPDATPAATRFGTMSDALLASDPSVERGRMLHAPGLRTSGGFFAFSSGDDVVVKLPAARVAALIAEGRGRPCVIRKGSPMREWVRLATDDRLEELVGEARAFVGSLPGRS